MSGTRTTATIPTGLTVQQATVLPQRGMTTPPSTPRTISVRPANPNPTATPTQQVNTSAAPAMQGGGGGGMSRSGGDSESVQRVSETESAGSEKKILGMKPWIGITVIGLAVAAVSFGVYKIVTRKK